MKYRQSVTVVPVERLTGHPDNVREGLGDLTDLARSIREHGILQPLTATELDETGQLLLLAGHRRLAASLLAGLNQVPVIIRHEVTDPDEHLVIMLVENTHRRDLSPVEKAQAYGALRNRGLTLAEIGRRVGLTPSTVSYYLNLLDLDDDTLEDVRTGELPSTVAIATARDARQEQREAEGKPRRGRKGGSVNGTGAWFNEQHRLAAAVRRRCDHLDRSRVGKTGCGPCWEAEIAADVAGVAEMVAADDAAREAALAAAEREAALSAADVDAVVQRVVSGDWAAARAATKTQRQAIRTRFLELGRPLKDLERFAGWKAERYRTEVAAS